MLPHELASKAADLIEKHGLCKGNSGYPGEGFCAMGAIWEVGRTSFKPGEQFDAENEVVLYLKTLTGGLSVPDWNDRWWRTKWGVIKALRKTSQMLKTAHENG